MTRAQITSEIATLAGRRVVNGSLTDQERDRLATLVAAQAGVSKEEAARRVARMEQDAVAALAQTEQQARKAADSRSTRRGCGCQGDVLGTAPQPGRGNGRRMDGNAARASADPPP